ncbi:MAG: o-succinylbenzoate synthase [Cyanobacteriota bacterium]|nr:o-succinylbenzoate synthase [Cyanobacteriota bacterium]
MALALQIRPYAFPLRRPLRTASGVLQERRGWLLRLEAENGRIGWGEVAPLEASEQSACDWALEGLRPQSLSIAQLEQGLPACPPAVAFALGCALAELAGLVGAEPPGWLPAPLSAQLLPAGAAMLECLETLLGGCGAQSPITLKWKVAVEADKDERHWLDLLLQQLPATAQLRLDANGGWDRSTATAWMERLRADSRFAWLEQPLAVEDHEGLEALARLGPVALDESLAQHPSLRQGWSGWQVRRPSQEGDPRPLLKDLQAGLPRCMVSTAFETGIGRRWLDHLAGVQWTGPTPAAPGLAPGWCPPGPLFSKEPEQVWQAVV